MFLLKPLVFCTLALRYCKFVGVRSVIPGIYLVLVLAVQLQVKHHSVASYPGSLATRLAECSSQLDLTVCM